MTIRYLPILLSFVLILASSSAFASIFITNLSERPQSFMVSPMGDYVQKITIAPSETWRTREKILRVTPIGDGHSGSHYFLRWNDHYAYWPDGTFGLQMRRRNNGGGGR